MSSFTQFNNHLHIKYSPEASDILGRDYWVLEKEFTYHIGSLHSSRFVTVPAGFLSDGATVPRILRSFVGTMGRHSQAAVLHDYLTETHLISVKNRLTGEVSDQTIDRATADRIFYESLEVLGVPVWKRILIRLGVDIFRMITKPATPWINEDKIALEMQYRLSREE